MKAMSFFRSFTMTSTAFLITMTLGAVTAKIIAVLAGPAGITVFFQLRQTGQILTMFGTLNGQNSVIRGVAARDGLSKQKYILTTGVLFALGIAVTVVVFVPLVPFAAKLLFPSGETALLNTVYYIAPLAFLGAMTFYYQAVLNGLRRLRALALSRVFGSLTSVLLVYPCSLLVHPVGYIFIVAGGFIASSITSAFLLRSSGWRFAGFLPPISFQAGWEKKSVLDFLPFAAVTLVTGVSGAATVMIIRTLYIREGGLELGGIFDAAWTTSMMYVMLLLSSFSTQFLPVLSGAKSDNEIGEITASAFKIAVIWGTVLVCTAIALKGTLIRTMYSNEFLPATELLRWTMIGDYFKITSWVFGMILIAKANSRVFVLSEVTQQIVLVGTVHLFLQYSREAAGVAYLFVNMAYLAFVWLYTSFTYKVKIGKSTLQTWAFGLLMVAVLSFLTWHDTSQFNVTALLTLSMMTLVFLRFSVPASIRSQIIDYVKKSFSTTQEK